MSNELVDKLKLGAQSALLERIPHALRAVSLDLKEDKIHFRCIFDGLPNDTDRDLLSEAALKILMSLGAEFEVVEDFISVDYPGEMKHLKHVVYLRHEIQPL